MLANQLVYGIQAVHHLPSMSTDMLLQ